MARPEKSQFAIEFGERVRKHRLRIGLSQERLGEQADLNWSYISSIERGERNLTLRSLLRIATGLGIDPGKLVSGLTENS